MMDSEQVREEAVRMLQVTLLQEDALRWTYMQVMAMIERNGFTIPKDPYGFFSGKVPLRPFYH